MSAFDETNLGRTVMLKELLLLLDAAAGKASVIMKHPATTPAQRKTYMKVCDKLIDLQREMPHYNALKEGTEFAQQFRKEVAPVLQNILIRKAEDQDES